MISFSHFISDPALRRKIYGLIFLLSGIAIGIVGISVVWAPNFLDSSALKAMATFGVCASTSAVFFIMTFRNEDLVAKNMAKLIAVCVLGIGILLIGEIWFDILKDTFFGKLLVTLFVLAGLGGFVMAVWDDFFENKRLKDENFLD